MSSTEAPVDVVLESSAGGRRRLSDYRGRVVVLFWEDREHQRQNAALKDALGRLANDPGLVREVAVVAVGDVQAYDFAPARSIVRGAITAIARVVGIEILFDWQGALARAPFSLQTGRSNVLVLDADGRPVVRRSGELDAGERQALLDTVRGLLGGGSRVRPAESHAA
jgi:hypothetical protein